jgi:hypothetical protein
MKRNGTDGVAGGGKGKAPDRSDGPRSLERDEGTGATAMTAS